MKKRGKIQKLTSFFLVFVMLLGVMLQSKPVFAEGLERVETIITNFTITTTSGNIPSGGYVLDNQYVLHMDWDASYYQNNLKEGDFFNITLPKEFKFPTNNAACNFDVLTPDGSAVVAKAVVTPNTQDGGGGNIKVTFTKYVEDRYDIKGSIQLAALFNTKVINTPGAHEITVAVGSYPVTIPINVVKPTLPVDELLQKWASPNLTNEGHVQWSVRINLKKSNLTNVVLEDKLEAESGDLNGIEYVPDSFILEERLWDGSPQSGAVVSTTDVSDKVQLSESNTKFRYEMGNIDGKQYMLKYKTTYKSGLKLKNNVILDSSEEDKEKTYTFSDATSGGQGSGDLTSKIKIIKVDKDKESIKLANAKFKITKLADNSTFELTTGANGEILSNKLIPGKYKIKEIDAPDGYILDNATEYEVTVTSDGACVQTIKNEPVKTNITVEKRWIGATGSPVTAILKADGTEVARHELTEATSWTHTFENLRKYQPGTDTEIVYTVEEETIPQGYTVSYATDPTGVLTITNTQEKTEVKVTKAWEDNHDQDGKRPESIAIKLLADGEETGKTLTLTKADNWTGTFTDLDEYKAGKKIEYTIKEEAVGNGYVSVITGSAAEGYKVTNTREPEKIVIEGSKTWNDKGDQDRKRPAEITINLLKNGTKINSVKVKESDGWKWKFENLDKYEKGNEITYTITEEKVEGYTTEVNGYNVKNSYTPGKTSIQVTKAWEDKHDQDGKRPASVTIKLLADGKEVAGEALTLSKENNWAGSFANLAEYKDGKKIAYTVKEVSVGNGYTSVLSGNQKVGYTITNIRTPNTPPPVKPAPKTGDSANIALYIALFVLAGIFLAGAGLKKTKKNKM